MSNDPGPPALGPGEAAALPTWRAAYSDRTAALMASFAELAYAPLGGETAALAADLAGGGFKLAHVCQVGPLQAILAVNPAELAVLAFRGTANLAGWGIDLDAGRIPMPGRAGIGVHAGFWDAWTTIAAELRSAVDALPADLGLYIAGHSLGGALAQIAAAELERGTLAACYTFGSPRMATRAFDALVKCPHYRIVDGWDLVPGVPAASPWGYQHGGDARLLVGAAPTAALRRDRGLAARAIVDAWSLTLWPLTGRVSTVDDHMIWTYRAKLQAIAAARAETAR